MITSRRWHVAAVATITVSGLLYLPTIGLGSEGDPSVFGQLLLMVPGLVFAAAALFTAPWHRWLPTPAALLSVSALWMAISALQSPDPLEGFVRGGWFAVAAIGLVAAVAVLGFVDAVYAATLATCVFVILGIGLHVAGVIDGSWTGTEVGNALFPWPRLRGLGANQSVMGLPGTLIVLSVFALRSRVSPTISFALVLIGASAILASHNRSALGALAIGVVAEAIWARRRWSRIALTAALIGAVTVVATPSVRDRVVRRSGRSDLFDYYDGGNTGALTGRGEVWREAFDFGLANPLTGRGNGAFPQFLAERFERGVMRWDPKHAHNALLEVFVDQGLVGLLIMLAACVLLLRSIQSWQPGVAAVVAAIAAHSVVEPLFSGSPSARWTFLVLAAAVTVPLTNLERPISRGGDEAQPVGDESSLWIPNNR